jgi:hypothetical protein
MITTWQSAILFLLGFTTVIQAGVLPPGSRIGGKTVPELELECWKWIYSLKTNENPMFDCEGRWANNRQPRADVFFIAPINGLKPPPCPRTFTIPEDTYILVPVLPITYENIDTEPPLTIPEFHDILDSVLNEPALLTATVDGIAITNLMQHRSRTPAFDYKFPDGDNSQSVNYHRPIIGLQEPTVADGYWLVLEPLKPGPHTIYMAGDLSVPLFYPRIVECTITVLTVPLAEKVQKVLEVLQNAEMPSKQRQPLVTALSQAKAFFSAGKLQPGINQLRSFQKELVKGLDKDDPDLFAQLNERAGMIVGRAVAELNSTGQGRKN